MRRILGWITLVLLFVDTSGLSLSANKTMSRYPDILSQSQLLCSLSQRLGSFLRTGREALKAE